ncbi:MAG: C40 family peptidase [Muribaculaceae bacterium]|nr:C40 family peptidase [Muribaculaceae bacterium]
MRNDYIIRLNFHIGKLMICLGLFCLCPHIIYADDSIPGEEVDVFMQAVEKTARRDNRLNREALANDIISYANRYLGKPYRRGGKGPNAFDCSGFTSFVFRHFDKALGASSRDQYRQGESVATSDVRPGDLLFFSTRRAGKKVGHVGIAVDVAPDGKISFIHAAIRGGIRVDTYPDGGYYSHHYIGARRVL